MLKTQQSAGFFYFKGLLFMVSGPILFDQFNSQDNLLRNLPDTPQKKYILNYLSGLSAQTIITEPNYFDRDYLDEFSSFYSRCSQGYKNSCVRLHFFGPSEIVEDDFNLALSNDSESLKKLKEHYLGFIVIRPIPVAPFGKTVLALYPDRKPNEPRITTPSRVYRAHICGMELKVEGLAWQQQDTGVAACATISLWTLFHSSAYDEHHSVPTTAKITQSAKIFGRRPFPSAGLTLEQILEAIHQQNLNPIAASGDSDVFAPISTLGRLFTKERFSNNIAAFVRSGYPVLVIGHYNGSGPHAICIVGFRDKPTKLGESGTFDMSDKDIEYVYVHDDNIGPNIRFKIISGKNNEAIITSSPPNYLQSKCVAEEMEFYPVSIITATHEDVRISADELYRKGVDCTSVITILMNLIYQTNQQSPLPTLTFSPRFVLNRDFFKKELAIVLAGETLCQVRRALQESVPPMSLHLGFVRIAVNGNNILMDILYDTTDSGRNIPSFVGIVYDPCLYNLLVSYGEEFVAEKFSLPKKLIPAFKVEASH